MSDDADKRDAERYRWLVKQARVEDRDGGWWGFYDFLPIEKYNGSTYGGAKPFNHKTVSAAIDAAMKKEKKS